MLEITTAITVAETLPLALPDLEWQLRFELELLLRYNLYYYSSSSSLKRAERSFQDGTISSKSTLVFEYSVVIHTAANTYW